MRDHRQSGVYLAAKRLLDVIGSLLTLIVLIPIFFLIAIAVRLDSPGPVLYRGQRIGHGRRPFGVLKFRSMYHGADNALHRDYVRQLLAGGNSEEPVGLYKLTDDPRVTRVGRVLRKWSLDELPQLLNVLRGEMSLVGPRPEVPYALDEYEPWQAHRFDVLPGLTGLWQVNGRGCLSPRDMLALDCRYADECSLWLDVRILVRTIPVVALRVGSA